MPTYDLGQPERFLRWEDLPDRTRQQIVADLAGMQEMLAETLRPTIDAVAEMAAAVNAETLRPTIDAVAEMTASLAPRVRFNLDDWMQSTQSTFGTLQRLTDSIRRWVPNWSDSIDADKAWALTGEGIPLVFVPRTGIVRALIAAEDHESRVDILLVGKGLIIDDCRNALALEDGDSYPESIAMLPELLHEAIDVLERGYYAASIALGVAVIDSALNRTSPKGVNYPRLKVQSTKTPREEAVAANAYRVGLAMRPLFSLLTDWHAGFDREVPVKPSRHVVAHWAQPDHMTEANAIIIVMTAVSLFLGLAERDAVS